VCELLRAKPNSDTTRPLKALSDMKQKQKKDIEQGKLNDCEDVIEKMFLLPFCFFALICLAPFDV